MSARMLIIAAAGTLALFSSAAGQAHLPTTAPISGRAGDAIIPSDVLSRVHLLRDEVDLIRLAMGKPRHSRSVLSVTNAAPREVFFQALALYRKADRLCFEQSGRLGKAPHEPSADTIQPLAVWGVVDAALKRVLVVKEALGLSGVRIESPSPDTTTPTDVFRAILQVNTQINLLLDEAFSPSEVYQQVTLSVHISAKILAASAPDAVRIPAAPAFESHKVPADVYRRLVRCLETIQRIAMVSGFEMLEVQIDDDALAEVTPSDVYDIASLVVSELAYIHSSVEGAAAPVPVHYPGRRFPSHVYQRAGILESQLSLLMTHVAQSPNWLKDLRQP